MGKLTICQRHEKIRSIAHEQMKAIWRYQKSIDDETPVEEIKDFLNDLSSAFDDIDTQADYAKDSGQAMEDRMAAYRGAIESLGFIRVAEGEKHREDLAPSAESK